jgi:prepilin-type N-terminal cleavage/methylation domain-containing protein
MRRPRTNGFTLVEMLVVIVIIAIMVGLTIPAVTNLMKSGGVSAASREVSNTLGLARQLAITQRTFARVVFPYTATVSQPDMWFRTYAVMTNRDNTVANGWAYASKWEYLPVGAVFLYRNAGVPPLTPLPSGAGGLDDPTSLNGQSLPFPATSSGLSPGPLAYIEFGPTGAATPLTSGGGGSTVAITEGFMSGAPPAPKPTTAKTSTNTLANLTTIGVDSLVGRIQLNRP